jgi:hypothetical protein
MYSFKLEQTEEKISQDKRDSLMYFNLRRGHSWYDKDKNKLYDEYGYLRDRDAKSFLLRIGAINEANEKLYQFQE